jgi:Zn finger protein HypA/HybF involved in hydrogenase expression
MTEFVSVSVIYLVLCYIVALRTMNVRLSTIQLLLINILLTPIGGMAFIYFAKNKLENKAYHFKCPKCDYYFTEELSECPLCEKEGVSTKLERVKILFT